jgi:antitoxin component YwqK of YwqJK toxin-antitoxin module
MKQIIFFLSLFVWSTSLSQVKEIVTKYDNGCINQIGYINENGLKDGNWVAYYENGVLWSTAQYNNGQKDGIWRVYKPDGKLYSEVEYRKGKRLYGRMYDETGKVVDKRIFEDYTTND